MQGNETRDQSVAAATAGVDRETELKLLTDPATLKQLMATPVIVRNARSKLVVRRLEATYYDTSDCTLARRGASLRVRRSGKRFIQTMKLPGEHNPLQRREIEAPVADMLPQLGKLPLAELDLGGEKLQSVSPVFSTKIRRHQQTIGIGDAAIEVAFDQGTLIAGERADPVCELELELKSGDAGALYELGLSLLERAPLRVGSESKAERGYDLASGTRPTAKKASDSGIASDDIVDEAIAKILTACLQHLMANLAAAEKGDGPDGIHQLRVALRRLRSAVSAFKREVPASALEMLGADAKNLAATLGPARNWDVFATTTIPDIEAAGIESIDFTALKSALEPSRASSYEAARSQLANVESTRFVLSLGRAIARRAWRNDVDVASLAALTQPSRDFADRALTRLHKKALKQGRHLQHLEPEARHELRITLKKLRYDAEFFRPLYSNKNADDFLRQLSKMQELLGVDNDVSTTQSLLREIEGRSSEIDVHRAIGAITGWQRRDRAEAAKRLKGTWRKFLDVTPFWQ